LLPVAQVGNSVDDSDDVDIAL